MTDDLERVSLFRADVLALAEMSAAIDSGSPDVAILRAELEDMPHTVFLIGSEGGAVRVGVQPTRNAWMPRSFVVPASVWQFLLIRDRQA